MAAADADTSAFSNLVGVLFVNSREREYKKEKKKETKLHCMCVSETARDLLFYPFRFFRCTTDYRMRVCRCRVYEFANGQLPRVVSRLKRAASYTWLITASPAVLFARLCKVTPAAGWPSAGARLLRKCLCRCHGIKM